HRRDRGLACQPSGEDPPVSGHELIASAVGRYHNRMQNAVPRNRGRKLRETFGVERGAGLLAVGPDKLEWDLACGRTIGYGSAGGSRLAEQDVEAAAQAAARHQAIAPPRAIGARDLRRAESSRARSS